MISRAAAEHSNLLKEMIALHEATMMPAQFNSAPLHAAHVFVRIPLVEISTPVMDMVCRYLCYKARSLRSMSDFPPLRACDPENAEHRALIVETLLAANYLDC
jgi:hypothetical protein